MRNPNDSNGNRTRDLPAFSAVTQPTALPRTTLSIRYRGSSGRGLVDTNKTTLGREITNSWSCTFTLAIALAERSKVRVCSRSLAGIAGSNPATGMDVSCECCVLSGRGIRDKPILLSEESYRLCCDLETSRMRRPWPPLGCCA